MIRSMIAATGAVARTVMVLAVLLIATIGCTAICGTRMIELMSCDSSCTSACEMKNVRITCSSYCARFCGVSCTMMIVRSLSTL